MDNNCMSACLQSLLMHSPFIFMVHAGIVLFRVCCRKQLNEIRFQIYELLVMQTRQKCSSCLLNQIFRPDLHSSISIRLLFWWCQYIYIYFYFLREKTRAKFEYLIRMDMGGRVLLALSANWFKQKTPSLCNR